MKYLFVPPKQSFQLKELGFDEPCFGWYSSMDGNPFRLNYCETYLGKLHQSTNSLTSIYIF
jgi:hypothetical protein